MGAIRSPTCPQPRTAGADFDSDRIEWFKGNTGPALIYATTRIRSIFRKAGIETTSHDQRGGQLAEPAPGTGRWR